MPESSPTNDPRLPSAQDLDAVSTEKQIADATVTNSNSSVIHVAKCFKCSEPPLTFCLHCGQEFCANHSSKYSTQHCYLCIAHDNLGLEYLPLEEEDTDDAGNKVVHHGRRIKLIGEGWPSTMQMVNSFPDTDAGNTGLEIFIAERQRLLKEAIATTEYHRITLSHAEFTKNYRKHSKAAKYERRYEELKQGAVRLSGKTHRMGGSKKQESEDEKLMKLLGLTVEELKAFKKVMNKI